MPSTACATNRQHNALRGSQQLLQGISSNHNASLAPIARESARPRVSVYLFVTRAAGMLVPATNNMGCGESWWKLQA